MTFNETAKAQSYRSGVPHRCLKSVRAFDFANVSESWWFPFVFSRFISTMWAGKDPQKSCHRSRTSRNWGFPSLFSLSADKSRVQRTIKRFSAGGLAHVGRDFPAAAPTGFPVLSLSSSVLKEWPLLKLLVIWRKNFLSINIFENWWLNSLEKTTINVS